MMRVIGVALAVGLLVTWPSSLWAQSRTEVATDTFTSADADLGAPNWAQLNSLNGAVAISSNQIYGRNGTAAQRAVSRWIGAGTFTNDQYSSLEVTSLVFLTSDYSIGVIARASSDTDGARDLYYVLVQADSGGPNYTTVVGKVVNGTNTTLDSTSRAWSAGNRVEIEVVGTTVRALNSGTAFFSTTDTDLTTGQPGVLGSGSSTSVTGDNWAAGNLGGSSPQRSLLGVGQ